MATKVIALVRVSTKQQDLEPQKEAVIREILHDGYSNDEIKVVEGKESAIKNDEEHRVTLNEMKDIIKDNPTVEAVYVFAIDRLARKVSIVLSVKDYLLDRNINLVFLNPRKMATMMKQDGKLVKDPVSEMLLLFLAYGAEMEMEIKKARFTEAKEKMKQEGKILGGKPMIGYCNVNQRVAIDPDKAQLIKDLFSDYLTKNVGLKTLYKDYERRGLLPPTAAPAARLQYIFRDTTYSGQRPHYPAIVTPETQAKAIDKMQASKSLPKHTSKNIYLAKGLIKDSAVNKTMQALGDKGCYRTRVDGKMVTININCVDSITWDVAIKLKALQMANLQLTNYEDNKRRIAEDYTKLSAVNKEIDDNYKRQDRAYSAYVSGKTREEAYDKMSTVLKAEEAKLLQERNRLESEIEALQRYNDKEDDQRLTTKEKNLSEVTDDVIRKEIIDSVIGEITLTTINSREKHLTVTPLHQYKTKTALPHYYIVRIGKGFKAEVLEAWQHPDGSMAEVPFTGKFLYRYVMQKDKSYKYTQG